jgi:predicted 3-demethylubiquinone-9 3-methyltransferase (glyoxalase superfamily)
LLKIGSLNPDFIIAPTIPMIMQKIIPHLWFDKEAKEAADFYTSLFPDSRIISMAVLRDTPSGDCDVLTFDLLGYRFMAISAGPLFKFNPSISFMVNFDPSRDKDARQKLDKLWKGLSEGSKTLMPLQEYPFSKRYGWIQDRYGISWQLIFTDPGGEERPPIIPSIMFIGDNAGKAEEATDFYISVFKDSKRGTMALYPDGMLPEKVGTVMFTDFMLEGQWFAAMDSAQKHEFAFSEAISFMIECDNQAEIDYYWVKLSAVPESEQCGWLKDRYGLSWQVTPKDMNRMVGEGSREQIDRLTKSFLQMKKFDLAKLKDAYYGS